MLEEALGAMATVVALAGEGGLGRDVGAIAIALASVLIVADIIVFVCDIVANAAFDMREAMRRFERFQCAVSNQHPPGHQRMPANARNR